jgi:hypothetical protein
MAAPALKFHFGQDLVSPTDHYQQIHAVPDGTVIVWDSRKKDGAWIKLETSDQASKLLPCYSDQRDVYITVNEFYGWRALRCLRSLRAVYSDIDGCCDLQIVLETLQTGGVPEPSFVINSGRGLHLYWILESTHRKALPLWQRVQDRIHEVLKPVGADPAARDCSRVLRLVGTRNGKNGALVRGTVLTGTAWDLHTLADEVLGPRNKAKPKRKASVADFRAAAARKSKKVVTRKGSIYEWWHLVYQDLCVIFDHYWLGGIPEGRRDIFLFLLANALSWFCHPDSLEDEIFKTAKTFTPSLRDTEVRTYIKPILKRAKDAYEGKKYEYLGREWDPRYSFKAETLRTWLGDLIAPELWPQLRALAPKEVIDERRREREKARKARDRVTEGRYKQTRVDLARGAAERRAQVIDLRARGLSWKEIAQEMGISVGAARNLGYRAK